MSKSIISEGKTTSEAIKNGLNKLRLAKKDVDIKVIEGDSKKSFFDILAPRIIKVELTVKDEVEKEKVEQKGNNINNKSNYNSEDEFIDEKNFVIIKNNLEKFFKEFFEQLNSKNIDCKIIMKLNM